MSQKILSEKQYCTFYLDNHFLGIGVREVQEVLKYQPMTSVPLADDVVAGLINLRGQIVTALDLRKVMGLAHLDGRLPMNIVVRSDDGPLSLLVDEIGDVVEVEADFFEDPPETLEVSFRHLIRGVYKLEGKLMLVLDLERAVFSLVDA
ncbi:MULTISPECIES: chemotaxis protein CheW [Acidithrix]|uniref:Chemotaxis protein CheW n=1 Tax=Acidithrix ferrooxidans TaxID=1280514 RepID=A0A0D8HJ21_9ACTN|nr:MULTISPECIES: chemotaxis protein CheW [Acidithrix]KJF17945.1 chemotaxis protein CheW [Acidithrix ferrooxidans]